MITREEALNRVKGYLTDIIPIEGYSEVEEIVKALEQEPCEDCISRQALLKLMGEEPFNWTDSDRELQAVEDYRNFRNIVEQLPFVNTQKSKPDVLDKIRAEILEEKEYAYADFERYKVDYLGQDWEDALDSLPQDDFRYGMERAVEIINKYIAESER